MLHAFNRKKSDRYKDYLKHGDDSGKRVSAEDEITSIIMGPLDYMPMEDVTSFWRHVITHNTAPGLLPLQIPATSAEHAEMHFWPRRENIEPDLLIKLRWPQGPTITLLVEFKWHAPLSGEDQLHRQWETFLTDQERGGAYHLFIAPDISAGLNAQGQKDVWGGHLLLRSWTSILGALRRISESENSGSAGFRNWNEHVTRMLKQLQIRKFQGFSKLQPPPEIHGIQIFWGGWHGFAGLTPPEIPDFSSGVFWSRINGFRDLLPPPIPSVSTCPTHFLWSTAQ